MSLKESTHVLAKEHEWFVSYIVAGLKFYML